MTKRAFFYQPCTLLFLILSLPFGFSQSIVDTTLYFQPIEIAAPRWSSFQTGTKKLHLDTFRRNTIVTQSLASTLSLNTPIFVKNYGPGRLATTSIRGANASQTTVLWNGFNLNNPMLGQTDFSLIPGFFVDQIALQYGSNSAAWGSGAIGGAILLQSKAIYEQGWKGDWNSSLGSFNNYFNGAKLHFSNDKFYTETKVFYQTGKNDFPIDHGQSDRLSHSQIKKWGILQKNGFNIRDKQQLNVHLWYQNTHRELPPNLVQTNSLSEQQDESFRSSLNWKYAQSQFVLQVRSALFYEQLDFQDAIAGIDSKSNTWTFTNELEWTKALSNKHSFNTGINYTVIKARSTGYGNKKPIQNRPAIFAAYHWNSSSKKWKMQCSFRQEWVGATSTPFIPAFGLEGKLLEALTLSGSISRSYRVPTFNDLFWQSGGNSELVPEAGWKEEVSLAYTSNSFWKITATVYNRNIDNWIIWLPNGGIWSSKNLQKVWSRGLEGQLQGRKQIGIVKLDLSLNYHLSHSTHQKSRHSL